MLVVFLKEIYTYCYFFEKMPTKYTSLNNSGCE